MADDFTEFSFVIPVTRDTDRGEIDAQVGFLFEHGWNPPEHVLREPRA